MRTRSQSRNQNRPQQQAPPVVVEPFNLEEPFDNPPVVNMAANGADGAGPPPPGGGGLPVPDLRTMEEYIHNHLIIYFNFTRKFNEDIFESRGRFIENLLNLDKTKDLPPYHDNILVASLQFGTRPDSDSFPLRNSNPSSLLPLLHNSLSGSTTSSLPSLHISETSDYFLEEFADELAHITFPPRKDELSPFDVESDL
ncbi:hypothetical protein Tco_0690674 [Tanacetum coccineum]